MDKKSSNYLRLLAKIERTIQNLEELLSYTPMDKQAILKQTIDILADLPSTIQDDHE